MKAPSKAQKILVGISVPIVGALAAASLLAARYVATIRPNTFVGPVAIGGLTVEEAQKKVRTWWFGIKANPVKVVWAGHHVDLGSYTPSQLDTIVDDVATIAQVPLDGALQGAEHAIGQAIPERSDFQIKYKPDGVKPTKLMALVRSAAKPTPAKFGIDGQQVYVKPEIAGFDVDVSALPASVGKAVETSADVELPVKELPKKVPDAVLSQITDVVSSYTTHFPARQFNRNNNIQVASGKLNGIVLLPGERLSFNSTVGRRTVQGGFKEAPVYKNGKHDKGIGGGICQVSSTLYNASLLGDFKIVRRQNHSMPVAYVPLGRDATVDYGAIDLVIENNYPTPIAVVSSYTPGSLTFRILGKRDPDLSVKIERTGQQDWDQETEYVNDPHLKPGSQVVMDRGSRGHKIYTYRLVYKAGKLVRREPLGQSFYRPSKRVVARGPLAAPTIPTLPASPPVGGGNTTSVPLR